MRDRGGRTLPSCSNTKGYERCQGSSRTTLLCFHVSPPSELSATPMSPCGEMRKTQPTARLCGACCLAAFPLLSYCSVPAAAPLLLLWYPTQPVCCVNQRTAQQGIRAPACCVCSWSRRTGTNGPYPWAIRMGLLQSWMARLSRARKSALGWLQATLPCCLHGAATARSASS